MTSANRPASQAISIQLRSEDLDFLFSQVIDPGVHTRNVSGFANNLAPDRALWGNANQPFLRLGPVQFEAQTQTQASPNAVRTTSSDGTTPLPNPRLVSDVIGQQALDAGGNTISTSNPYGNNLFLMSFGQFFDHGLDFYMRGGGPDLVPIANLNEQLAAAQSRLNQIRAAQGLPSTQLDLTDNLLTQLKSDPQPFDCQRGDEGVLRPYACDDARQPTTGGAGARASAYRHGVADDQLDRSDGE